MVAVVFSEQLDVVYSKYLFVLFLNSPVNRHVRLTQEHDDIETED